MAHHSNVLQYPQVFCDRLACHLGAGSQLRDRTLLSVGQFHHQRKSRLVAKGAEYGGIDLEAEMSSAYGRFAT